MEQKYVAHNEVTINACTTVMWKPEKHSPFTRNEFWYEGYIHIDLNAVLWKDAAPIHFCHNREEWRLLRPQQYTSGFIQKRVISSVFQWLVRS